MVIPQDNGSSLQSEWHNDFNSLVNQMEYSLNYIARTQGEFRSGITSSINFTINTKHLLNVMILGQVRTRTTITTKNHVPQAKGMTT